jgi:predicted transposase YbfD/YdcC
MCDVTKVVMILKNLDQASIDYPIGIFDLETDQLLPHFLEQIEKTNDINITNDSGATALIVASASNLIELAKALIEVGANVNQRDDNGYSALLWACLEGNTEIVKLLIDQGADIFATNCDMNALEYVVRHTGDSEIVKILLDAAMVQDKEKEFKRRTVRIDDGPSEMNFIIDDNKIHVNGALLQVLCSSLWYDPHDIIDVLTNDTGFNKNKTKDGGIGYIIFDFVTDKSYEDLIEKLSLYKI